MFEHLACIDHTAIGTTFPFQFVIYLLFFFLAFFVSFFFQIVSFAKILIVFGGISSDPAFLDGTNLNQ